MPGVRLVWDNKGATHATPILPLQTVEVVNTSRADRGSLFEGSADAYGYSRWSNHLIWGDNLQVLASLKAEIAGQVDLIYIDPPFDSRRNYKVKISVGDGDVAGEQDLTKLSSIIEERAYNDTWGRGVDSYLQMLFDRLLILRDLLSDSGSIFLHLTPNVAHLARVLLDEIFGPDNFRAEIAWKRTTAHADAKDIGEVHDNILCYSKSPRGNIWNRQYVDYDPEYVEQYYRYKEDSGRRFMSGDLTGAGLRSGETGRAWRGVQPADVGRHWAVPPVQLDKLDSEGRIFFTKNGFPRLKRYLDEARGQPLSDVWTDIRPVLSWSPDRLGYDTQKPESLLERIIRSSSDEGSLVLDCFSGSGTTAAVAERLGRRWIAVDVGRFAVHTTRKRLLEIPGCRPFAVSNLGQYERQVWQETTTGQEIRDYLDFIVHLYGGVPTTEHQSVHGSRDSRAVHVGAVDAPVSFAEIDAALEEAKAVGFPALDVLGWEFEFGLHEVVQEKVRDLGVPLTLRRIPSEVMDAKAIASNQVIFHELAYLGTDVSVEGRTVRVSLTDFVLSNPELVPISVRNKVRSWSDYIDYWAVDFTNDGRRPTFLNQWQSYRTRKNRTLELVAEHEYELAGRKHILVKAVDIFGNDTTTVVEAMTT